MESVRRFPLTDPAKLLRRIDLEAVTVWLLGFGLVLYLALNGGGYDTIVRNQVGVAVWWIVMLGIAIGFMPVRRPGPAVLASLGLLVAFVVWTALSSSWSDSSERTVDDLSRVVTYLGVFMLALSVRGSRGARRLVGAVASAIVVASVVALLSRLHPAWFSDADQTAQLLGGTQKRLSYPVNYWNGLGALVALGIPLVCYIATSARTIVMRALAAGALPAMALTLFLTYSRGGAAAAILGLLVFLALANDRLPKLATLLAAGSGGAILIAAALQRDALEDGLLNGAARDQGNEMLAMTLVVCAGVALVQVAISLVERYGVRPNWSRIERRQAGWLSGGLATVCVVIALAFGLPGKANDAWTDFKDPQLTSVGAGRFQSFGGNRRYQLWSSAVDQNRTDPLKGSGSGTFEFWWASDTTFPWFVRDAHSLYLETLGELGVVGLGLLLCFLLWSLGTGVVRWATATRQRRTQLAAALGGCAAFCLSAAFDWVWELSVVPIVFLLLLSVLITAGDRPGEGAASLPTPARAVLSVVAIAATVAIAVPLASAIAIDQSQDRARSGDLSGALSAARTAQNVQPYAATPRLQEALVLERQGDLAAAAAAARAATDREPTNWRTWVILSRIEAERSNAPAAVDAYRRARSLNSQSPLFAQ
jgi:hypothetical protein